MRTLLALSAIVALTACAHIRDVQFESEPAGARVEFNGEYLGKTPLRVTTRREINDWSNIVYAAKVQATYNGCTLKKSIPKGADTPRRMFFDFSGCDPKRDPRQDIEE